MNNNGKFNVETRKTRWKVNFRFLLDLLGWVHKKFIIIAKNFSFIVMDFNRLGYINFFQLIVS